VRRFSINVRLDRLPADAVPTTISSMSIFAVSAPAAIKPKEEVIQRKR